MDFVLERLYKDNKGTPLERIVFDENGQSVSVKCHSSDLKIFRFSIIVYYRRLLLSSSMRSVVTVSQYLLLHHPFLYVAFLVTCENIIYIYIYNIPEMLQIKEIMIMILYYDSLMPSRSSCVLIDIFLHIKFLVKTFFHCNTS